MKEISFKMTITLGGGVNINCIYYTIFSKVLCLIFCQIPSPYQDSHMQIRSGSPDTEQDSENTYSVTESERLSKFVKLYLHDGITLYQWRSQSDNLVMLCKFFYVYRL